MYLIPAKINSLVALHVRIVRSVALIVQLVTLEDVLHDQFNCEDFIIFFSKTNCCLGVGLRKSSQGIKNISDHESGDSLFVAKLSLLFSSPQKFCLKIWS